eukprot:TRINITY_DN1329_c0_g1_i3.p1 TRINITY_DN1329_c0_g1~~TRINITY_DN1329_c0_g1_i3.p1  ORF type:complete len:985 (+),score=137.12 TRINITY_DN1329_c0_g1_i3:10756-13710(+)
MDSLFIRFQIIIIIRQLQSGITLDNHCITQYTHTTIIIAIKKTKMTAFEIHRGTDLIKNRIESMDASEGMLCYGDNKGFVYLSKLIITDKDLVTKEIATTRISKNKVDRIAILSAIKLIVVLSDGKLLLLDSTTLENRKVLVKSGVTLFAISPNDHIAIASGKKLSVLFYDPASKQFLPPAEKKAKEIPFPDHILKMAWNGDYLGVAHKKAYAVVNPKKGLHQDFSHPNNTLSPNILVFKDNWIVVNGDSVSIHEKLGSPLPGGSIPISTTSKSNPVLAMAVKSYYLLVFREGGTHVYNLLDFVKIQEIDFEKGFLYKDLAIDESNVILAMDITIGSKKEISSRIVYLHEIPVQEQIKQLLAASKVPEAHKVFLQDCPSMSPDFETRKEQFNADAAWALFTNLQFSQGVEYFLQINYDPRELLALVPEILDSKEKVAVTLKELIERKMGKVITQNDPAITEGINAIISLLEEKRKYLANTYNIEIERKKTLAFAWPTAPLNPSFKGIPCVLEEMMRLLDTALLKLYVENKQIKRLQAFLESTLTLKCNYKEMETYFKDHFKDDPITCTPQICQAFLHERAGNLPGALAIWKQLVQQNKAEIRELVCKAMVNLLVNKVKEKKLIKDYARAILILNPEEGMRIFTENEALSETMTEDEVIDFLEKLETFQPALKEQYLEYLVKKPGTEERFHTRLGLHYVAKIKDALKKEQKTAAEAGPESLTAKCRRVFSEFLKRSKTYSTQAILEAIKGMGLFEEEILLYSMQKMHNEALTSLVEMGKHGINFSAAEQYCLEQSESLLALLFEKIVGLYIDAKNRYIIKMNEKAQTPAMKSELEALRKYMYGYEAYCKGFLKRYAANEKMDAEAALSMLPDDWSIKEQKEGKEDDSLLTYLILALNDRLGKDINYKIARNAAEMQKLNLEYENAKLQKAFVLMNPGNICKVCNKALGTKTFYVYPNGVVTHTQCAKDVNICPVTNVNFNKKVYD